MLKSTIIRIDTTLLILSTATFMVEEATTIVEDIAKDVGAPVETLLPTTSEPMIVVEVLEASTDTQLEAPTDQATEV